MKGKYRKGIFLIVFRREKGKIFYLVLKRKLHWKGWEFPKGGIEKKEKIKEAIKREMKEEIGLKARKIINLKVKGKFNYPRELEDRPGFKGQEWKLFAVEVSGKKVKLDKKEHSCYSWKKFDSALKILTWPNQKRCLKIVNEYIKNGRI